MGLNNGDLEKGPSGVTFRVKARFEGTKGKGGKQSQERKTGLSRRPLEEGKRKGRGRGQMGEVRSLSFMNEK